MVSLAAGLAGRRPADAPRGRRAGGLPGRRVNRDELAKLLLEVAIWRAISSSAPAAAAATTSTNTASRPTRGCWPAWAGAGVAGTEHAGEAELLAGPELGAVPLASVTSVETGLPFRIGKERGKGVRHGETSRGRFRAWPARLRGRRRGHIGRCAVVRGGRPASRRPSRFRCNFAWSTARRAAPRRSPRRVSHSTALYHFRAGCRHRLRQRLKSLWSSGLLTSGRGARVAALNPFRPRNDQEETG